MYQKHITFMAEMDDPLEKLYLSHTEREWKTIEKRLADLGKKNLSAYVMGKLKLFDLQYSEDKDAVIHKIPLRHQKPLMINKSYLTIIGVVSLKRGIPVATLIDRFIIDPLMLPLD